MIFQKNVHIQMKSSTELKAVIFTEWENIYKDNNEEIIIFFLSIIVNILFNTPDGYDLSLGVN